MVNIEIYIPQNLLNIIPLSSLIINNIINELCEKPSLSPTTDPTRSSTTPVCDLKMDMLVHH